MNLDKLFLKLNKRKMFGLADRIFKLYSKLAKPERNNILILSRHIEPSLLRRWVSSSIPASQEIVLEELNRLIDHFDAHQSPPPLTKKKIAVCLSGEPRSFRHCIDSFKRFFHGHDIDIFIACRENTDIEILKNHYNPTKINIYNDIDYSDLEKEGIKAFGFIRKKHDIIVPQANPNLYPMWYGIKQSFLALTQSSNKLDEYDAICRCRFDTFFKTVMPDLPLKGSTIYLDSNYNEHNGYSDQFAIGAPHAMKKYFQLFDWLPESYNYNYGERGYLPERILKTYLDEHLNIVIMGHLFETRLLRDEFIGLMPHQIPLKGVATNKSRDINIQESIKARHPDLFPTE